MNHIPHEKLVTADAIAGYHARVRPNAVALRFEGRDTTYEEFDHHTNQIAHGLLELGVRAGDRVVHCGKNSDFYLEAWWGAAKMGAVMVPVGWRLTPREIAVLIGDSRAPLVFAGEEFLPAIDECLSLLRNIPKIIVFSANHSNGLSFVPWRNAHKKSTVSHVAAPSDPLIQLYTSGTTGRPKGVMISHLNLSIGRRLWDEAGLEWNTWKPDDVSLVAMPVAHMGGSGWSYLGLYFGCRNVIVRQFDPRDTIRLIESEHLSRIFLVPTAIQSILSAPGVDQIDFRSLRTVTYGASPITDTLLESALAAFKCDFVQVYGMTETTGTVVSLAPEDHRDPRSPCLHSAGKAMPGIEIKIVRADNGHAAPGEQGEIAVRGPTNMLGYWNDPNATDKVFTKDGWILTGDVGYLDSDGYLYIQDRLNDTIISGGENVYPAEVENALSAHPAVAEVSVIGVPDERWGEAVKAILVVRPGVPVDEHELLEWARGRLASYKTPKSITFAESLPRNEAGKVLRRKLREPYWLGSTRQVH